MDLNSIRWINHAGFRIEADGKAIYIDPYKVKDTSIKADIILITHPHFDHYSIDDIKALHKDDTVLVIPEGCEDYKQFKSYKIVKPGDKISIKGVEIEAVQAYNTNKERLKFHPRENRWNGYIVNIEGKRVYHAGDTDFIPEMKELSKLYAALLPMGGTYTMDLNEFLDAARAIDADYIIPMHYKILLGQSNSIKAEEIVKKQLNNAAILKEIQEPTWKF
ncbi:MAG: L-ascorbate-6-phosphate lactonase UlaG [Candidatus Micrarchaeota archaeon]|nr:MAG: L-ascorbate-6-phosphate lactonase UlaG [Candidatus Micrarchaeota archaeon]